MAAPGRSPALLADPAVVLGRVAAVLADGAHVAVALDLLVAGLSLRAAAVRTGDGHVIAGTGGVLRSVPVGSTSRQGSTVEIPLPGRVGSLTVVGARTRDLPALRAAAAVIALGVVADRAADAASLLEGLEQERGELADALHDGPVQALVAARWAADAAVRGGSPLPVRDAVQGALVDVRRALWHLRPRGSAGLGPALLALAERVGEAGGPVPVVLGADGAAGDVDGTPAATAYRLVQAVAQPGCVPARICLERSQGHLVVQLSGGCALAHHDRWTERARALGGDLTTRAGHLRLDLPVPEPRTLL